MTREYLMIDGTKPCRIWNYCQKLKIHNQTEVISMKNNLNVCAFLSNGLMRYLMIVYKMKYF